MKIYYTIFLQILLSGNSFSQDTSDSVFYLDKLPSQGVLLDKGWKFQAGDNPDFAKPDYDDSKWQSINPTLDIHNIPTLWKNSIVWFRLHFKTDSFLISHLAMMVAQSGASEMFLNGKPIHRFGVVSTSSKEIVAYNPREKPISLPVTTTGINVLTVRYALQPHIGYSTHWGNQNPGLSIIVNTIDDIYRQYQIRYEKVKNFNMFLIGGYAILCLLYFAFYWFNSVQKVNLFFSLYASLQVIFWAVNQFSISTPYVRYWYYVNNFMLFLLLADWLFMLFAIYYLFGQRKGWMYYSLVSFGIISLPFSVFIYGWGWLVFGFVFSIAVVFEITRISFIAVRKQKKGAWIIATGSTVYLLFWLWFLLPGFLPFFAFLASDNSILIFNIANFSLPVAVSIFLGYDFALTYRSLQQKLTEVQTLSLEKQQILSAQKEVLEKQVAKRTAELKQSLEELKATQQQLIQQEKMASLGELTAGIAHEIQNPLNFVNNFSEVNKELIGEIKSAADSGRLDEVKAIANNIDQNEEKIIFHGKRAEAIVKGMLQHSKTSGGIKEPTDISKLADEYLRLSYHGVRAKDKNFSAEIKTDFDPTIEKINVVPQDIGRVILNLINNAFYAVNEKQKQNLNGYEATVWVTTTKRNGKVEIKIKDNGNGIAQNIVDKIFQPFFTTKPTGQGTGLGLSLAYDIVKAHGGKIRVETKEGEGSEFIILIPVSQ